MPGISSLVETATTSPGRCGQIIGIRHSVEFARMQMFQKKCLACCMDTGTALQKKEILIYCNTLLSGEYLREALFWQFTKALFSEVQVSCKDTALHQTLGHAVWYQAIVYAFQCGFL